MALVEYDMTVHLTNDREYPYSYVGGGLDLTIRQAVKRYHEDFPTRRIEWVRVNNLKEGARVFIPHLDGWIDEQPDWLREILDIQPIFGLGGIVYDN